ncbi:hypothetical protein [Acidisoma cladoniae]|uniref:hypothetical protein n=1 Tax=Acidisoma cladoniae TaxID=3040935 RepID=UPI00254BA83D|nr:hypothetical protein [Acidisoma sp. PAMC 29798]
MVLLLSSPERKRLIRNTKHSFESYGWEIVGGDDVSEADFIAKHDQSRLFIQCIDENIRKFISNETLISQMSSDVSILRARKNVRLVYVLNFTPDGQPLSQLLLSDVIAFHLNEVEKIIGIATITVYSKDLDERQVSLLKSQRNSCLRLSRNYLDIGGIENAIDWARFAVQADKKMAAASYVFLLKILVDHGYRAQAAEVSELALSLAPDNLGLLSLSKTLAHQLNHSTKVEQLNEKIQSVSQRPDHKFRQRFAQLSGRDNDRDVTLDRNSSPNSKVKTKPKRWFRRLIKWVS